MSDNSESLERNEFFSALAREDTLVQRVVQQMEEGILSNRLQAGDRLPTERELARQFGVSRTVVREAVSALTAKSLIVAAPGGGSVICMPSAQSITQSMTLFLRAGQPEMDPFKVHEVRRVLEVEIAGLAAERRTEEDIALMEGLLLEMSRLYGDWNRYERNDVEFHEALARASQNTLFVVLLNSIADIMLKVREISCRVPGSYDLAVSHHRAILAQVRAGHSAEARHAMEAHLADAEIILRQGLAQRAQENADA